ncbi:GNAT family N-acetyltransferase [Veronia nyctiphanis]|uniref:GNAT family N-acetyltransferase n=1 Tax=Veronia nyctiphanis TaxID=1278244 RepID=A0A4Q0YPN1_9GAMM|nr:GNAT family N-acetyltransferase [Veronia nyctiphanis]RXJ71139.1 GNAT family N-acetyltransferase [Veronia nyctiphanis]
MIEYRKASLNNIDELKTLLWKYGPNEWNHLTPEGVDNEFKLVETGSATTITAIYEHEIIGFAVLIEGSKSPNYLEKYGPVENISFIGDVVVSDEHSGKGVATQLLTECILEAEVKGKETVLIERHEENLASAGMMRKAGFTVIDTFLDTAKRNSGSRKSVILESKI